MVYGARRAHHKNGSSLFAGNFIDISCVAPFGVAVQIAANQSEREVECQYYCKENQYRYQKTLHC